MCCSRAGPAGGKRGCLVSEVPPCPKLAWLGSRLTSGCLQRLRLWPANFRDQKRFIVLLLTTILSFQGSLYESSNLDRGGNNRKKKIEEFSRSSREKIVQSKNKMFSKFTSILQHAVEAVSLEQKRNRALICFYFLNVFYLHTVIETVRTITSAVLTN